MGTPAQTKEKKPDFPLYEMEEKGKLILPPSIISQITFLHSHCGTDEWSGLLLYDVIKGNPSKPEELELEVKHIFLMDIGSAAHTEYETDGDIVDIYDEIPEAMEMKLGHVHTHHSGGAYFSGVDMSELQDNVDKHNYYLSLVVNFNGNYKAKVVFLSDMHTTSKMNFVDDSGVTKHFKQSKVEKHMVVINMRIMYGEIGGFFANRLEAVQEKIEKAKKAEQAKWKNKSYGGHHNSYFQNPNSQLPAHEQHHRQSQRAIGSKIIPDKMTSWEVERLTRNVLMFDTDLRTEGNVYGILHQINKEGDEASRGLFYDYMISHVEGVIDAFFDEGLSDQDYVTVIGEMIMSIKKFEGIPALSDLISNIEESFETVILGYDTEEDDTDLSEKQLAEKDIADQLENMEKDLL